MHVHSFDSWLHCLITIPFGLTGFVKSSFDWVLRRHSKLFPRVPLGDRLYQRVRRKLHSMDCHISEFSFKKTAWVILCRLTSPGLIAFETAASLRSGKFHDWEIYAFYRLAGHLEPRRTVEVTSQTQMKQSFKFRNLTKPPMNSPLSIPFLAHPDFNRLT